MATSMSGDADDTPTFRSLPTYDTAVALDRAYERDDGECAACGESGGRGETVLRHIWPNDFAPRSEVTLCHDCAGRDDWRDDVYDRRVSEAGSARGWLITRLWDYSTPAVYRAVIAAIATLLVAVASIGVVASGSVDVVELNPWVLPAAAAVVTFSATTVWVAIDPRGSVVRDRPPWHSLAVATVVSAAALWGVYSGAAPTAVIRWGLVAVALAATVYVAVRIDTVIRADQSRGVVDPDMTLITRVVTPLIRTATAFVLVYVAVYGLQPLLVLAVPVALAVLYLGYRTPNDDEIRTKVDRVVTEVDDLLYGGPF